MHPSRLSEWSAAPSGITVLDRTCAEALKPGNRPAIASVSTA